MIKHKTILVSCFIEESPQAIPLAASILKSFVSDIDSLHVELFNIDLQTPPDLAVTKILDSEPNSIGFSLYIWNRDLCEKIIYRLKEINPSLIIYAGGAEVTASYSKLSVNQSFDYLLPGEGEIPFRQLMAFLSGESETVVERIMPQKHVIDLETIPSPYLNGTLDPESFKGLLWELSRGCPFNCSFCSESRGISGVRCFSEDRIIRELIFFEEKKVEQIFVLDPTFNVNKGRALKILSLIAENAPWIHYTFEIRAELLDPELAEVFSSTHCSLQIGLQSAHREVLKKLNRDIDRELFSEKIALLNQYGAVFGLDLIFGLPGDTFNGFLDSLDFAVYQIPNHLDVFRLSVFPGTELFEKAAELQLDFLDNAPYSIQSTPDYSAEELIESEHIAYTVDLFYNKGRSAPWLLSVIDYLDIRPSLFFRELVFFLSSRPELKSDPLELQTRFLIKIFSKENNDKALATALDLALFHHLYAEVLHSEPETAVSDKSTQNDLNNDVIYRINSNTRYGIFSYDVTLYSEMGMIDIESFIAEVPRNISYGLIFNLGGEIMTMGIEKYLYQFIQAVNGERTIKQVLQIIKKKADEAEDFIDFLIDSELIIPAL